jgi:hypothetical protein
MPRRLSGHYREPELVHWSDVSGLWIVFGVALLLGLLTGAVWVAWRLVDLHVLR